MRRCMCMYVRIYVHTYTYTYTCTYTHANVCMCVSRSAGCENPMERTVVVTQCFCRCLSTQEDSRLYWAKSIRGDPQKQTKLERFPIPEAPKNSTFQRAAWALKFSKRRISSGPFRSGGNPARTLQSCLQSIPKEDWLS